MLAQYFGRDAMNSRLLLFETTEFTTTPEAMLLLLTRVVADRSVGAEFFGNYYLMDYELMGGDARDAIVAETRKRGMTAFLPPLVPFGSHEWPWMITPVPVRRRSASPLAVVEPARGSMGERHGSEHDH